MEAVRWVRVGAAAALRLLYRVLPERARRVRKLHAR